MSDLGRYLEHTRLGADTTRADVERLCAEACDYDLFGVCVPSAFVAHARRCLGGSPVCLVTVAGFPLGNASTPAKAEEARIAALDGADEVDVVAWLGAFRGGQHAAYEGDLRAVVEAARVPVKAILETGALDENAIVRASKLAVAAGVAFVKTSTGFGPGGATVDAVRLLRTTVGVTLGVKASGGIRDASFARDLIAAGATRIGTSSGVAIVNGD
jgi:deoxyribose-phosphate aldolase